MIELHRDPDWNILLTNYMTKATTRVGAWGKFDCALNCADAILAITHVDIAPQIRNQYTTEREAQELLRSLGFANTMEYAASYLPMSKPVDGFSGDLGAFRYGDEDVVGVIYKGRIFSPSTGITGMGSVNLFKAHTVFKVGTP